MNTPADSIFMRPAASRGRTQLDWLDGRHSFSFGHFQDAAWPGFRDLRVINEDRIAPGGGFPTHPHRNMEIITWVLSGALEHRDSLGHGAVIRPGQLQVMSAGAGIRHSEFNASQSEPVHLLQIWIQPAQSGLPPRYEQRDFPPNALADTLCLLASPDGAAGSVSIAQDVRLFAAHLRAKQSISHTIAPGRAAWIQIIRGTLLVADHRLAEGDGLAISADGGYELKAHEDSDFLFFDLR